MITSLSISRLYRYTLTDLQFSLCLLWATACNDTEFHHRAIALFALFLFNIESSDIRSARNYHSQYSYKYPCFQKSTDKSVVASLKTKICAARNKNYLYTTYLMLCPNHNFSAPFDGPKCILFF